MTIVIEQRKKGFSTHLAVVHPQHGEGHRDPVLVPLAGHAALDRDQARASLHLAIARARDAQLLEVVRLQQRVGFDATRFRQGRPGGVEVACAEGGSAEHRSIPAIGDAGPPGAARSAPRPPRPRRRAGDIAQRRGRACRATRVPRQRAKHAARATESVLTKGAPTVDCQVAWTNRS